MSTTALVMVGGRDDLHSQYPKELHALLGKTVLSTVVDQLRPVADTLVLVLPEGWEAWADRLPRDIQSMTASDQRGLTAALSMLPQDTQQVLLTHGDAPLVTTADYQALLKAGASAQGALLYSDAAPGDKGDRVLFCEDGGLRKVAYGDELEPEQEELPSISADICCFSLQDIRPALPLLADADTAAARVVNALLDQHKVIRPVQTDAASGLLRVKTQFDLTEAIRLMKENQCRKHMSQGVTIIDPNTTYIDEDVDIGADTVIYPGCFLQNGTKIGQGCTLLSNCRLNHAVVEDRVTIESSVLLDCHVGSDTTVGPFAYLRPKANVGHKCRIGDFVEIKNSNIGNGTKVSHLTYVGDSDLGEDINLGCGVVFVNYDGKIKQRSVVEDHAFIGCNTNLVAPVHVGKHAYIAAGATITEDVPEDALYVARSRGVIKENWVTKRKEQGKL